MSIVVFRLTESGSPLSVQRTKGHMSLAFDLILVSSSCQAVLPPGDDPLKHFDRDDHDTICKQRQTDRVTC